MKENRIRVVIVDDNMISRSFFETAVRSSERYVLAASFPFARDAVAYCRRADADLLIMDVLMRSGPDGLTAARTIRQEKPGVKIILVTSTAEEKWMEEAREIGVEAFWFKNYGECPLLEVMDRTMEGDSVYRNDTSGIRIGNATREELSERELDVLRELTTGAGNEEIAENLHISVNTVKTHIRHLLEKTGFSDRLELAINATRSGIVVSDRERQNFV